MSRVCELHLLFAHSLVLLSDLSRECVAVLGVPCGVRSNAAYAFLLDDRARARVEAEARVEMVEEEANALSTSKNVHTTLVVAGTLLIVRIVGGTTKFGIAALIGLPCLAFWLGGLADARRPTAGATAKAACAATAEALASIVGYYMIVVISVLFVTNGTTF